MNEQDKNNNLDTKKLIEACDSTIKHLTNICNDPDDMLQVLMHVTAAALANANCSPKEVVAYFMKITQMLDWKFDRNGNEN